jgi:hypothetical protein
MYACTSKEASKITEIQNFISPSTQEMHSRSIEE